MTPARASRHASWRCVPPLNLPLRFAKGEGDHTLTLTLTLTLSHRGRGDSSPLELAAFYEVVEEVGVGF